MRSAWCLFEWCTLCVCFYIFLHFQAVSHTLRVYVRRARSSFFVPLHPRPSDSSILISSRTIPRIAPRFPLRVFFSSFVFSTRETGASALQAGPPGIQTLTMPVRCIVERLLVSIRVSSYLSATRTSVLTTFAFRIRRPLDRSRARETRLRSVQEESERARERRRERYPTVIRNTRKFECREIKPRPSRA